MTKKYENADGSSNVKSFAELRQWQKERRSKKKDLSFVVPRAEPETTLLSANRTEPTVTFIGHSTFLVQLGGLNIVTDPVWALRMGFAPRLSPPGLPIESLPPIDVVVLSHAHYDHLHLGSLRRLPGDFIALVPVGLAGWFRRKGFGRVEELSWWSETRVGNVTFGFVPAKHWTRRTPWDTNSSHWGGWVMRHDSDCLYFAGDSGYDDSFRQIGAKYGDIRVALIPIGAYEPEWFMGGSHMTPEEAIQTFADVGARYFVPMHYGSFRLADDTPKEALDRLDAEWERRGLPVDRLWTMEHGRTKLWSAARTRL
ncbi:L-ascorbate metabolism protein UlaG, beta-lactamase superfamily [Cohnella sp. OV330]|uniref:MBL fold metallo-hydrolase n=1 Tax=Cohnella sp. OV330 TaxID=1855288 RepID=UPI0008EA7FBB|nr:MBL fold metallo-hydrolase [Cohnella sp. OV330]SFB17143.1 L-ascorbate metabolism protein UlaG, beta-lactamase superfamily [Cohnella sp. OV330]